MSLSSLFLSNRYVSSRNDQTFRNLSIWDHYFFFQNFNLAEDPFQQQCLYANSLVQKAQFYCFRITFPF